MKLVVLFLCSNSSVWIQINSFRELHFVLYAMINLLCISLLLAFTFAALKHYWISRSQMRFIQRTLFYYQSSKLQYIAFTNWYNIIVLIKMGHLHFFIHKFNLYEKNYTINFGYVWRTEIFSLSLFLLCRVCHNYSLKFNKYD